MKRLFLLNIIIAALSAPAHAATIQAYATQVITTDGSFSATAGGTAIETDAKIQEIIASDKSTAIYGYNADDYSRIDLDFGDITVKTGSGGDTLGADLAIVSLWNSINYNFGLEVFDTDGNLLSSYAYGVTNSTPNACDDTGTCFSDIKTTSINLYSNDFTVPVAERELADNIEIGYISLFIGGDYNGSGGYDGYSNFSLAGAYHTDAVVVPLPLPSVLFSSGLLLLGWVGRRKKHS